MKQRNYYLSFVAILAMLFLPFSHVRAAWDMGSEQLGTITLTRGETKTINATTLQSYINLCYKFDDVDGWFSGTDAGFYTHNYQNDNCTKFSVTGYATCYQQKLSLDMYYTQSDGTYCVKHFYYLVTVNSDSYTKVERDVELVAAGTLSWRINSSDKNTITHLTLHGDLNGDDLRFLREMAGYNDNQGNLRYLDLRDVHFVAGGSSYATLYGDPCSITSDSYSIPEAAFYWCRKLTEIWLPEKVESIGVWAFNHCDFLTTVHIPEGTKYIYGQNFHVCYNLKELSIPSTVTEFYPQFYSSYKFRTFYCYAVTPPTRGTYPSFENCTTLYVPQGCKNDYLAKEGWGSIANIYESLPKPKLILTATPEGGQVPKNKSVKLKATASDAEIYYTIDGSKPSKSSTKYENYVTIDHPLTLKAIAYHDKYITSDVLTEEYTVKYGTYDLFTSKTIEGVEVKYQIADDEGNSCKVYSVDKNTTGKVTIPESVYGMPVVEIERYRGFCNCNKVTSVSLPSSMKRIGASAFSGCTALTSVTGLNNVEFIGQSAFYNTPWFNSLDDGLVYIGKVLYEYKGTMPANTEVFVNEGTLSITSGALSSSNLMSLIIPKSVRELEGSPVGFYSRGLKNIVVASGNPVYDSRNNCNAIIETATNKLITGCSSTIIPNNVKVICGGAFLSAPEELIIPNSVDSIAQTAIRGTTLKKLTIGTGLRKIATQAIYETSINSISVASGNPYYDSRNNCNAIIEKSTNTLVMGCPSTIIPNTVKTIGRSAFYTNTDGFNSGRITIPESIEKIETFAFNGCQSLGSVVIGSNVSEIGENAFYGCDGLVAVYALSSNPIEINDNVFRSMSSDKDKIYTSATLVVPHGARINYLSTSGWNKFSKVVEGDVNTLVEGMTITKEPLVYKVTSTANKTCELYGTTGTVTGSLSIPSHVEGYAVTSIAPNALAHQEITSLSIPATVVSITYNPLYNCNELLSISVDQGNPKYDSRNGCNAIVETATNKLVAGCKNTVIPNNISHIGPRSFFLLNTLTTIDIPSSVEVIDSIAFAYTGISELCIPSSVKRIEFGAFEGCNNLTVVTSMIERPFAINDNVFECFDEEKHETYFTKAKLRVPYGTKTFYTATDGWKKFQVIEEMEQPIPIMKGDVNDDGSVNGTDLVALTNIILGKNPERPGADVNGDGSVNGTDYVALANIILGKSNARRMTDVGGNQVSGNALLHIEPFDISAGETKEMIIDLDNSATDITLVQFDLRLPAGLTLKQTNGEYDIDIAGRTTWRKHSLDANQQADGSIRFLLASSSNAILNGSSGAVISVMLVASSSFNGGDIKLENILMVSPDEQETTQPTYTYTISPTPPSPAGTATLSIEPFYIQKGGETEVLIDVENPENEVTLVQFDLRLPDGLTLKQTNGEYDIDIAGRTTWKKHSLDANATDGIIRFLLSSTKNAVLEGTSGAVVKMTLQASTTFSNGIVKLENALLVSPDETESKPDTYQYEVKPANVITITAKNSSREYGEANPTFEYEVSGGTPTGTPTLTCAATKTSDVGTYEIVVGKGTLQGDVVLVNGTMTVTKAPLTASVGDYTREEGHENPEFVISYSGWKNSDNESVLTRKPTATTTATTSSAPGSYPITVSGGEAKNYEFTYKGGTLTVSKIEPGTAILSIEPFGISAGETNEMVIDLTNPDDEITLVQFDLRLPTGLSLKMVGGEYDIDIAGRTTWKKHSLDANATDGIIRFLLSSTKNAVLEGTSGAIIKMTLVADNNFKNGEIKLENILLVTPDEKEIKPGDIVYNPINVGIATVPSDDLKTAAIYSLSGQRLAAPKRGINIIDGKKVVIK